jgi:predicted metal-dependent phosphoesterase TrpH
VRADLHVHSNASDGTDPPAQVVRNAAAAGLDAIALTDHDTVAGHAEARAALPEGLMLISGMELSCHLRGRSVHLLAYRFDPDRAELAAETERIRDDRIIRAKAMVARLAELGADVTWEQVARIAGSSVVGRPHIARAMAEAGVVTSPEDAFTADWIADDGRAYVAKYALDPARAIRLISEAGGVSVLAHPRAGGAWNLSDEEIAGLAAVGLAGVEVFHPDHPLDERRALLHLVNDLGLMATAGSDDHGSFTGNRLGAETSDETTLQTLLSHP